jgi:hypothetical protein
MTEQMTVAPNERRIQMPESRTLIIAAAVGAGAVAAGLVMYYYLRKRRDERMVH